MLTELVLIGLLIGSSAIGLLVASFGLLISSFGLRWIVVGALFENEC